MAVKSWWSTKSKQDIEDVLTVVSQTQKEISFTKIDWKAVAEQLPENHVCKDVTEGKMQTAIKKIYDEYPSTHLRNFIANNGITDKEYTFWVCQNDNQHNGGVKFTPAQLKEECPTCKTGKELSLTWWQWHKTHSHLTKNIKNLHKIEIGVTPKWEIQWMCFNENCNQPIKWSPWTKTEEGEWEVKTEEAYCVTHFWVNKSTESKYDGLVKRETKHKSVHEKKIANSLKTKGFKVETEYSFLVPETMFKNGVLAPDILLPDLKVAIEYDLDGYNFKDITHASIEGAAKDLWRDSILADLGWKVLRIREPYFPTLSNWPWRIDINHEWSRGRLVEEIMRELQKKGLL